MSAQQVEDLIKGVMEHDGGKMNNYTTVRCISRKSQQKSVMKSVKEPIKSCLPLVSLLV